MLLVISFPIPVDLTAPGAVRIDGAPTRAIAANTMFHAIVVPAGTHVVRLLF